MIRGALLWLVAAACAASLVGWNLTRLAHGERRIRTKELDFLPSPTVARLLALGQDATVAKLRWIDSFAYFQLQLDRQDDRLPGGGTSGGFQRLYDTLIALDPGFEPFYQHAALCTSGVLGQHQLAFAYLLRGTIALPHESALWRHAAAMLHVNFDLDDRAPARFTDFLRQWERCERDPDQRQGIWAWQANLAKRKFAHLEELPTWFERLRAAPERTPMGDWIEGEIREELAVFAIAELQALVDAFQARRLAPPVVLQDVIDRRLLAERYGDSLPAYGPIGRGPSGGGGLGLRPDPWGYPYALVAGKVVSPGLQRTKYARQVVATNSVLEEKRRDGAAAPARIEDLAALDIVLDPPPAGGRLELDDGRIEAVFPDPPEQPWRIREMAAADAAEQRAALSPAPPAPPR